jgi:hypothetical protein
LKKAKIFLLLCTKAKAFGRGGFSFSAPSAAKQNNFLRPNRG